MTHQQPVTGHPSRDTGVEDLQVLISTTLTQLTGKLPNLRELVNGHQRGLGFLTPDARAVMDDLVRTERRDRIVHAQQGIKVIGETPAPGNLVAWTLLAEIDIVLAQLVARIVTQMNAAGVCPLVVRYDKQPSTEDLASSLRELTWRIQRRRLLELTHRDLTDLVDRAQRALEGDDKVRLDGACPHCGRKTLVVHFSGRHEGVIRCDRDPHTGQYETCVCPDSYCDCKTNPRHRHEWHRDKGTTTSGWWSLADRLNLTKQIHQ